MQTKRNKVLYSNSEALLQCLTKNKTKLDKDNFRHKTVYHERMEPARTVEQDYVTKCIPAVQNVHNRYGKLDSAIKKVANLQFIDLDNYSQKDRLKRRIYTSSDDSVETSERNTKIIDKITSTLPKYSRRAIRRDFINKYSHFIKTPKSVLRHMFSDLTGSEIQAQNKVQDEINQRVTEILLGSDDPDLLLDFRKLNGKEIDTIFDVFYDELGKYFDEQIMQVHERRHSQELYMPLAISVEDLQSEIIKRIPPDVSVPSVETIRLQFTPNNAFQKSVLKYSGKLDVKFRVQTRQARVNYKTP
ncbi:unnamed protein product [Mytilus coruscus]|uniref:Uncharacterized protein n=1 Tax=Mytilus coruscus TaxID=42192 RepID=A0A6J8AFX0_MYTCO|nr:unnamed protein product [Mytilus coruscus]